jgi:tetratricopeptide (TPR) repeat protein
MRINTEVENSSSERDLSHAETLKKFGLFFQKMGELDLAVSVYSRVLDLGADSPELRYNFGAARLKQIRPTEALEHFKAAARREPSAHGIHLGMANSHQLLGDITAAEACLKQELLVNPEASDAAVNLGWILEEQNRVPEALMEYRKALYYEPNDPNLRWNHGLACLMLGDFTKGWRDYEFRWKARKKQKPEFNAPEWRGDPLEGRSLLLHTEQGFGDSIMFLRFARQLARARNRVALQCQPQLKRLFNGVPELDAVLAPGDALPAFDVHAPLMEPPQTAQAPTRNRPPQPPVH